MNIHQYAEMLIRASPDFNQRVARIRETYIKNNSILRHRNFNVTVALLGRYFFIPNQHLLLLSNYIVYGKWPRYSLQYFPASKEKIIDIRFTRTEPFILINISHDLSAGEWRKLKKNTIEILKKRKLRPDTYIRKPLSKIDRLLTIGRIRRIFRGGQSSIQQLWRELRNQKAIPNNWEESQVSRETRKLDDILHHL